MTRSKTTSTTEPAPPIRRASLGAALAVILVAAACDGAPVSAPVSSTTTTSGAPATAPSGLDWHDTTQTPTARAHALLAAMTLDEKIGQMTQLENGSVDPAGVTDLLLGSVLSGGGGAPTPNEPEAWYSMVAAYQQAALTTRLGIPILYGVDAVHGASNVVGATIFPHNVGLGATADPALVERIGRATATELAATGIRWDFGPVVAVPQDVRWGRTYEGYGEDPVRVGELASSFITGLQGTDLAATDSAAATAKHFLGDGGTAFGSSTTDDYLIDQGVDPTDEATLRAVHLPPYAAAIKAGARIVMASFSSTTAGKVHGDRHLLTDLLKGELGFSGFVVSDWAGVDQVDPDYTTAVARAIGAGIDMVMVPSDGPRFQAAVRAGLASGAIAQTRIDDAVSRILRVKFELGLFEHPMPPDGRVEAVGSAADRALARTAVAESMVLLKTAAGVLPVGPDDTVLLTGPGADDIGTQSGGWTVSWQGRTGDTTPGTTIADAMGRRLGDRLSTYPTADAIPADAHATVGIVVLAEPPYAEGKGDSATLALSGDDLLTAVRPKVDRLVVVILSGRPMMLDTILPTADAVVEAWLPGTEGTGVADVLVGDQPFVGTTPYTWPDTAGHAPRTGKAACDGAVFPRGFGLSASGRLLGPAACGVGP
ncbi:MAG TPA: glycoside hydrolase family 3 protein [Candidatus Limnocylindrales bacterium]|nr:glycoside hydrolase family 3 protein [Candidatus Limnocylindrales bacterium]